MAKENGKVGLLQHLTFAPEHREDGGVTPPLEVGRIRYFWSTFRKNNGPLLIASLLFLITLLPLIAVLVVISVFGAEQLSYRLFGVTELPYFLSGVGIGMSNASSVLEAKLRMLRVWQLYYTGIGAAMLFMSIGLAGMMHLSVKFVIKDSFICKKDSYGNQVPKILREYFLGIKKYWWQMLIVGVALFLLVAGVGNGFCFFLGRHWQGIAGAGEWILILFLSVVALIMLMVLMFLAPTIVLYDIPFAQKIKNAAIFAVQMFVQNIFVLAVIAAPFLLAALTDGIFNILIIAVVAVYGAPLLCIILATYVQYYSEKIITPVYQAKNHKGKKKKHHK